MTARLPILWIRAWSIPRSRRRTRLLVRGRAASYHAIWRSWYVRAEMEPPAQHEEGLDIPYLPWKTEKPKVGAARLQSCRSLCALLYLFCRPQFLGATKAMKDSDIGFAEPEVDRQSEQVCPPVVCHATVREKGHARMCLARFIRPRIPLRFSENARELGARAA